MDFHPAVGGPTLGGLVGCNRVILPESDSRDAGGRHTELDQDISNRHGPTVGEISVRFGRAHAVGVTSHLEDLTKGIVDLKDVVYYLSFITFGLFLTHQSVESQRWRA